MDTDHNTGKITAHFNVQDGRHVPFMYACSGYNENGMALELNHVGAMLELDVKIEGVVYVTLAGNRKEPLSPLIIDPKIGSYEMTKEAGGANVQITVPKQIGKTYIAVPPVRFVKGFSLILTDSQGQCMFKSYSSDGSLAGGYDFTDKNGYILPITLEGDFVPFGTLENGELLPTGMVCDQLNFNHDKSGGMLTGTSVSFRISKQGAPDKLIESWGARLIRYEKDDKGNDVEVVYRNIEYTNETPVWGETVTMDVADNWKLLPAGTYCFTPYYRIYGEETMRSLATQELVVEDPGVEIVINGTTSYDKYLDKKINEANSHTSSLIDDVTVSLNVDKSIIDSFSANFNNNEVVKDKSSLNSGLVSFGDITKTVYQTYPLEVTMMVGPLKFTKRRDFHITGLPYSINLEVSSLHGTWIHTNMTIAQGHYLFQVGTSAIISPKFHVPSSESYDVTSLLNAYAYQGWGNCDPTLWMSAIEGTLPSKGGDSTKYSGTMYYPNEATWINTTRNLTMNTQTNRVCIYVESTKSTIVGGIGVYGFGPGLVAKTFTLTYR